MEIMREMISKKYQRGFTLVEMIVVVGVLGVLALIVLAAINPREQLAKSRDTKRSAEVEALANAVHQYFAETGELPEDIDGTTRNISSSEVDLCDELVPTFISALPQDPSQDNGARIKPPDCSDYDTGYTIRTEEGTRHFVVEAPLAETAEVKEIR